MESAIEQFEQFAPWRNAGAVDEADPLTQTEPDTNTGTTVLERPVEEEQAQRSDDGDADRFAHYVSRERIEESRLTGRPVVALCGKVWVPKHDPKNYPVCPECKRIFEEYGAGGGGF